MQKFAGEGLRTLALAERYIDENFFYEWRKRQQEAATSLNSREDRLGEIYEEIECEMTLLGVTAIEDKLQVCLFQQPSSKMAIRFILLS